MNRVLITIAVGCVLCIGGALRAETETGSLKSAEFPDIAEFDFQQVKQNYKRAEQKIEAVSPILDETLQKARKAVECAKTARELPTDENKRAFVDAVLDLVNGASEGKARTEALKEEIRGINSELGILYSGATAQVSATINSLRQQYERERKKFEELVEEHKKMREQKELSEWELRNLYAEELRQARVLDRLATQAAFHRDFKKALEKALKRSAADFTLYEEFFSEASDALQNVADLGITLPIVVTRVVLDNALSSRLPRASVIAGFDKIAELNECIKLLADTLMQVWDTEMSTVEDDRTVIKVVEERQLRIKKWLNGQAIPHKPFPAIN